MVEGLTSRTTTGGINVLRLHYKADPKKRPDGALYPVLLKGYPGGTEDPRWRKEMEIEYGALAGTRLFPHWEEWTALGQIVIPPFDASAYRLFGSYDHGNRHPACYLVHGVDYDGRLVTVWEFWASYVPATLIAEVILGHDITLPDGRHYPGNPYAGRECYIVADPSIEAKDIPNGRNPNQSTSDIFLREGVVFIPGKRGEDLTVASWLHGHFWRDPENPLYRITSNCPRLVYEIGRQRFRDYSAKVALTKAQPEQLLDKDNDAWDAMKYFIQQFPPPKQKTKPKAGPNTFLWWQGLAKGKRHGTYRLNG